MWHVVPVGEYTWRTSMVSWNKRYPDLGEDGKRWHYADPGILTRDAQAAHLRLLGPGWGLRLLPRKTRQSPQAAE